MIRAGAPINTPRVRRRATRASPVPTPLSSVALPVVACQPIAPTPAAPPATPLRFYSPRLGDPLFARALARSAGAFARAHPGTRLVPETEVVPAQAMHTLTQRAAAGQLPDVLGFVYVPSLASAGLARDLTDRVSATDFAASWSDLAPGHQASVTAGGRAYGLPVEAITRSALIYDKRNLAAAGLDPAAPPAHWDEFLDAARRTTRSFTRCGFALIAQPALPGTYARWFDWFATAGGAQFVADGPRVALDQGTAGLATLRLYRALSVEAKVALPNSTELDGVKAADALAVGQVAMIQAGSTSLARLRVDHPDVVARLGVGRLPWSSRDVAYVQSGALAIGAQTRQPDLTWELLRFLASPDHLTDWFRTAGMLPASGSGERAARAAADPLQEFFLDRLAGSTVFVPGDARLPAIIQRGGQMVHDVICGCVQPSEALQQAVADMARLPTTGDR